MPAPPGCAGSAGSATRRAAELLRSYGLTGWQGGTVSQVEAGVRPLAVEELLLLCAAYRVSVLELAGLAGPGALADGGSQRLAWLAGGARPAGGAGRRAGDGVGAAADQVELTAAARLPAQAVRAVLGDDGEVLRSLPPDALDVPATRGAAGRPAGAAGRAGARRPPVRGARPGRGGAGAGPHRRRRAQRRPPAGGEPGAAGAGRGRPLGPVADRRAGRPDRAPAGRHRPGPAHHAARAGHPGAARRARAGARPGTGAAGWQPAPRSGSPAPPRRRRGRRGRGRRRRIPSPSAG